MEHSPWHYDFQWDRDWFEADLVARFVRYARVWTTSDRHNSATPSTPGQWDLARLLDAELAAFGVTDRVLDENCYLHARLPATRTATAKGVAVPAIGFLAHLDTAPDFSGEHVQPQVRREYDGGPIPLGEGSFVLDPAQYPALAEYRGDTIIHSDGTTLLGADDKAGIAEIMTALRYLCAHPEIPHGPIEVTFTPDEEIGRGADHFPFDRSVAVVAYTLDGGDEATYEAECFNAAAAEVRFRGAVIHPGDARGKLANACTMAAAFVAMLPRNESPEATDGRFGFYHPIEIRAGVEDAVVSLIVRDFDAAEVQRRLTALEHFAAAVEAAFPPGRVVVETHSQYRNMRDGLAAVPPATAYLARAIALTGAQPRAKIIRGGTDGARLTERGLPTPNIFAGGQNMHSRFEWVPLRSMVRAAKTIINLALLWAGEEPPLHGDSWHAAADGTRDLVRDGTGDRG